MASDTGFQFTVGVKILLNVRIKIKCDLILKKDITRQVALGYDVNSGGGVQGTVVGKQWLWLFLSFPDRLLTPPVLEGYFLLLPASPLPPVSVAARFSFFR